MADLVISIIFIFQRLIQLAIQRTTLHSFAKGFLIATDPTGAQECREIRMAIRLFVTLLALTVLWSCKTAYAFQVSNTGESLGSLQETLQELRLEDFQIRSDVREGRVIFSASMSCKSPLGKSLISFAGEGIIEGRNSVRLTFSDPVPVGNARRFPEYFKRCTQAFANLVAVRLNIHGRSLDVTDTQQKLFAARRAIVGSWMRPNSVTGPHFTSDGNYQEFAGLSSKYEVQEIKANLIVEYRNGESRSWQKIIALKDSELLLSGETIFPDCSPEKAKLRQCIPYMGDERRIERLTRR